MLRTLRIDNFLLIRGVEIEFGEGLNVISGETGTGKSMTISAIEFVMGKQRDYPDGTAVEVEIVSGDEELILRREMKGGRSRYFLNGRGTTAKTVRELLSEKVSLQGQNEFVRVLREDYRRNLLDRFGGLEDLRRQVEETYREISSKRKTLEDLISKRREALERKDYIEYRLKEIEEVGLTPEEVERLKETADKLKHLERLSGLINRALAYLYDAEGSAYERITEAIRTLAKAEDLSPDLRGPGEELLRIKEELVEVVDTLRDMVEEVSPEEVDRVNEILFKVQRIERKYGKSYGEVLKETEDLKRDLSSIEDLGRMIRDIEEEIRVLEVRFEKLCSELSESRRKAAQLIEGSVKEFLKDLNLDRATLKINVERTDPGRFGADKIEFLFSAHGEEPRPLGEVASGGELTRLFLALSLILPPTETYIFDEVDAGISGETSVRLAKMLRKLSRGMQIIAITHSAPVCAAGDVNFLTEKRFLGDIPYIEVRKLSPEEKVREVARLMGATTETTIRGAEDLIRLVRE